MVTIHSNVEFQHARLGDVGWKIMTTNHPDPTPPPSEPAPSLRPVEESVFRAAIEAGTEQLRLTHWDGSGCGTDGTGGCSRCYGPSPADASEVAEDVLDAAWPIIAARLRAAEETLAAVGALIGEHDQRGATWVVRHIAAALAEGASR